MHFLGEDVNSCAVCANIFMHKPEYLIIAPGTVVTLCQDCWEDIPEYRDVQIEMLREKLKDIIEENDKDD